MRGPKDLGIKTTTSKWERVRVITVEIGVAFLTATFLFLGVLMYLGRASAGHHPSRFEGIFRTHWIWPWIAVFAFVWCLRRWFMREQWVGRDLTGSDWRRVRTVVILFLAVYLGLWTWT